MIRNLCPGEQFMGFNEGRRRSSVKGEIMADTPSISLFGRVGLTVKGAKTSPFRTRHCAMLLTYLCLHKGKDVTRTELVDLLWPMSQEGSTRNRLSVTYYHLRGALKDCGIPADDLIFADRNIMRLNPGVVPIDYLEFQEQVVQSHNPSSDSQRLENHRKMIDIYSGPLAQNLSEYWLIPHQSRTAENFEEAVISVAKSLQDKECNDEAALLLEEAISTNAGSERAGELLINWYSTNCEFEKALSLARQLKRALSQRGRNPSKNLQAQIEQLNLILVEKMKIVPFADEALMSLLGVRGGSMKTFKEYVQKYGGEMMPSNGFAAFRNPLQAIEAGRLLLLLQPDSAVLIHTTVIAPGEPVPTGTISTLNGIPKSAMFGNAATAEILRTQGSPLNPAYVDRLRLYRLM